ncbi:hypothetical protein M422DRAFT_162813, partial [Sphaerobolus stellatus SS14]
ITSRDSQMRGELREKLIPIVREVFGFRLTSSHKDIQANRKLYDRLKKDNAFIFKDSENRKGLYEGDIIQLALNVMWFASPKLEGITFESYFRPIPFPTIALIFTAVSDIDIELN